MVKKTQTNKKPTKQKTRKNPKPKNQKAPSQFLLYLFENLYYLSRECCTTLIISMYIYSPCVDPALSLLSAGYPTLPGFLLSLSP